MLAQTFGRITREDDGRATVHFERVYDYGLEELWAALTEPEQLRGWLGEVEIDLRVGGRVVIRFDEAGEQITEGIIRELDPPRLLEYDWTYPGETESVLRLELEPRGEGTLLVLDHRRLPDAAAAGYGAGWHSHLDVLAALGSSSRPDWDTRFAELLPDYRVAAERA
jgi:uncharacterized protein YndB with AHSA1/START domain